MINALAEMAGEAAEWAAHKLSGRKKRETLDKDVKMMIEIAVGSFLAALALALMMVLEIGL